MTSVLARNAAKPGHVPRDEGDYGFIVTFPDGG